SLTYNMARLPILIIFFVTLTSAHPGYKVYSSQSHNPATYRTHQSNSRPSYRSTTGQHGGLYGSYTNRQPITYETNQRYSSSGPTNGDNGPVRYGNRQSVICRPPLKCTVSVEHRKSYGKGHQTNSQQIPPSYSKPQPQRYGDTPQRYGDTHQVQGGSIPQRYGDNFPANDLLGINVTPSNNIPTEGPAAPAVTHPPPVLPFALANAIDVRELGNDIATEDPVPPTDLA
ncbi:unnamed protein product, partial [Meganyctiphanes norvegica]